MEGLTRCLFRNAPETTLNKADALKGEWSGLPKAGLALWVFIVDFKEVGMNIYEVHLKALGSFRT